MKKPPVRKKGMQRRLEHQRWQKRLESKRQRRRQGRGGFEHPYFSQFQTTPAPSATLIAATRIQLVLPVEMDLIDNYDATVQFIRDLHRAAHETKNQVVLDFAMVERIRPTALLLLLAELHRCQMIFSRQRVTGLYPKHPKVERLLEATGFFNLIKVKHRNQEEPKDFPLSQIKFISDVKAEGDQVAVLRQKLFGERVKMPEIARGTLFRSLTEAIQTYVSMPIRRMRWPNIQLET